MNSFGWKKKIGGSVSKTAVSKFKVTTGTKDNDEEEDIDEENPLKWVEIAKKRKLILLEDAKGKSNRLRNEGTVLAEAERYWEAIKKWDEALTLTPQDDKLLEMKAQAQIILHEVFPAVQTAEKAVQANPQWWVTYQTLGRAQMGLGEIHMAIRSFSKAIHTKPDESELWDEDLKWACTLQQEKLGKARKKTRTLRIMNNQETLPSSSQPASSDSQSMQKEGCAIPEDKHDSSLENMQTSCKTYNQETLPSSSVPPESKSPSPDSQSMQNEGFTIQEEKHDNLANKIITSCKTDNQESQPSSSSSTKLESLSSKNLNKGIDVCPVKEPDQRSCESGISHRKENVQRQMDATGAVETCDEPMKS